MNGLLWQEVRKCEDELKHMCLNKRMSEGPSAET